MIFSSLVKDLGENSRGGSKGKACGISPWLRLCGCSGFSLKNSESLDSLGVDIVDEAIPVLCVSVCMSCDEGVKVMHTGRLQHFAVQMQHPVPCNAGMAGWELVNPPLEVLEDVK